MWQHDDGGPKLAAAVVSSGDGDWQGSPSGSVGGNVLWRPPRVARLAAATQWPTRRGATGQAVATRSCCREKV